MVEQPSENIIPSVGETKVDYCLRCHTMALQTCAIYAISSESAQVIGGYAVCGDCGWSPYQDGQGWRERAERAEAANARTRERLDALIAAGFGATTDTLRELRAALDDQEASRG